MPLSSLQASILGVVAQRRTPESYVAGATPLNQKANRFSHDIDIFHDLEEQVCKAAVSDAEALSNAVSL